MLSEGENIRASHQKFAEARGDDKTYCPSEVARELFPENWRERMDDVRKVADQMVKENKLYVLQKGVIQSELPSALRGPIRLRIRED